MSRSPSEEKPIARIQDDGSFRVVADTDEFEIVYQKAEGGDPLQGPGKISIEMSKEVLDAIWREILGPLRRFR